MSQKMIIRAALHAAVTLAFAQMFANQPGVVGMILQPIKANPIEAGALIAFYSAIASIIEPQLLAEAVQFVPVLAAGQ